MNIRKVSATRSIRILFLYILTNINVVRVQCTEYSMCVSMYNIYYITTCDYVMYTTSSTVMYFTVQIILLVLLESIILHIVLCMYVLNTMSILQYLF